ncbi:MAG: hypothetical protein KF773_05575 [Deltaproteobacteria bacterium]|nr:hypothetical protein [Deltaproteobacteria bacterium]MCW5808693.1 hypothetical protein [Deltaproteobacteria bacterium]
MRGAFIAPLLLSGIAGVADADPVPEEPKGAEPRLITPEAPTPPPRPHAAAEVYTHKGQLGISARLSTGLRAIATYDDSVYCGDTDTTTASMNAPVCTGRTPFNLDFELAYGAAQKVEPFVEVRLGIEGDFGASAGRQGGPHAFHISPGARFYFSDAGKSKLFTTAQVVLDFTGYQDPAGVSRGADFGVRNMNGLWVDLDRAYGFYVYVGETMKFSRWLQFELEGGVGIQARYR